VKEGLVSHQCAHPAPFRALQGPFFFINQQFTLVSAQQPAGYAQERGLASPVATQQTQQLPTFQHQVAILKYRQATVSFADSLQLNPDPFARLLSVLPARARWANSG